MASILSMRPRPSMAQGDVQSISFIWLSTCLRCLVSGEGDGDYHHTHKICEIILPVNSYNRQKVCDHDFVIV